MVLHIQWHQLYTRKEYASFLLRVLNLGNVAWVRDVYVTSSNQIMEHQNPQSPVIVST
jgi:hypothetical protein